VLVFTKKPPSGAAAARAGRFARLLGPAA
jgi:hypothetical protein